MLQRLVGSGQRAIESLGRLLQSSLKRLHRPLLKLRGERGQQGLRVPAPRLRLGLPNVLVEGGANF
ncbi:hypothetical protein [Xanthomonas bromi]|uniref:hypothetical protein n=1 Tax=Xanthomonas bromi TaxID=56449 RepID=UPI001428BC12|nr:hypothetical protein [Xanthomonas bromi]